MFLLTAIEPAEVKLTGITVPGRGLVAPITANGVVRLAEVAPPVALGPEPQPPVQVPVWRFAREPIQRALIPAFSHLLPHRPASVACGTRRGPRSICHNKT